MPEIPEDPEIPEIPTQAVVVHPYSTDEKSQALAFWHYTGSAQLALDMLRDLGERVPDRKALYRWKEAGVEASKEILTLLQDRQQLRIAGMVTDQLESLHERVLGEADKDGNSPSDVIDSVRAFQLAASMSRPQGDTNVYVDQRVVSTYGPKVVGDE